MRSKLSVLVLVLAIGFSACVKKEEPKNEAGSTVMAGTHKAIAQEVLQVTQYTYMRVNENGQEFWVAGPKTNIEKGAVVYFGATMEMKNFKSTDLNRVFDSVLFVQELSTSPITSGTASPHGDAAAPKAQGGVSIAELYSNLAKYGGKSVKVRGKILKLNTGIMGKNWAHIQDGTDYKGNFDLTVTTLSEVKVGDDVTFEGTISLNKDFGYGYSYPVLMEDARSVK